MIPREFPASQANPSGKGGKRKSTQLPAGSGPGSSKRNKPNGDDLDDMLDEIVDFSNTGNLDNFDSLDLDFNKPLPGKEDDSSGGSIDHFD